MDPGNSRGPVATRTDDQHQHPADTVAPPTRMPCRTRGCSATRPVVSLGCARLWDRCDRCAGRVIRSTPYAAADDRPSIDFWTERVWELLEAAEMVSAGAP